MGGKTSKHIESGSCVSGCAGRQSKARPSITFQNSVCGDDPVPDVDDGQEDTGHEYHNLDSHQLSESLDLQSTSGRDLYDTFDNYDKSTYDEVQKRVDGADVHSDAESSDDGYAAAEIHVRPMQDQRPEFNFIDERTAKVKGVSHGSTTEPKVPLPTSAQDVETCQSSESVRSVPGIMQYKITADPSGGTFYSKDLLLSGTIPEEAVGEDTHLLFWKEEPESFQAGNNSLRFISSIYHVLPHGKIFNKQIVLRFPHRSNKLQKFENVAPCRRIRRKVYYSPTTPAEVPQWEEIGSEGSKNFCRQDIQAIITEEEACLMLLRFCCFAAVEEKIQTKFVFVNVYGLTLSEDTIQMMIAISTEATHMNSVQCGILLEQLDFCLVHDVAEIKVRIKSQTSHCWRLLEGHNSEKVLQSHFLWNNKRQQTKFVLNRGEQTNTQQTYLNIEVEHDGDTTPITVTVNPEQLTIKEASPYECRSYQVHHVATSPESINVPIIDQQEINLGGAKQRTKDVKQKSSVNEPTYAEIPSPSRQFYQNQSLIKRYRCQPEITSRPLPHLANQVLDTISGNRQHIIQNLTMNFHSSGYETDANGIAKMHQLTKSKLSHHQKIELSRKLDSERFDGKDWRALADKMGFGAYENQIKRDPSGPTRWLLNIWESKEGHLGSIRYLVDALKAFGRSDAASIIEAPGARAEGVVGGVG